MVSKIMRRFSAGPASLRDVRHHSHCSPNSAWESCFQNVQDVTALPHVLQNLTVDCSPSRIRGTSGLAGQLTVLSYLASPEHPGEGHYDAAASTSKSTLEDNEKPSVTRVDVGFCFASKNSKKKENFGAPFNGHGYSQDCKFPEVSGDSFASLRGLFHT